MIKQLTIGLMYILIITVILTPITYVFADTMTNVMSPSLLTTIMITIMRFFGFFIGVGTLKWIYKGLRQQEQQQYQVGY